MCKRNEQNFPFSASILHELNEPQPQMNSVKVEHPGYYYPEQTPSVGDRTAATVDAMVVSAAYCKFNPLPPHQKINRRTAAICVAMPQELAALNAGFCLVAQIVLAQAIIYASFACINGIIPGIIILHLVAAKP